MVGQHSKKVLGSNSPAGCTLSMSSLHVLLMPFLGFFPKSKAMQISLIDDTKSLLGMTVSMNGCVSVMCGPAVDWWSAQGVPQLLPNDSWDQLPLVKIMDGWM